MTARTGFGERVARLEENHKNQIRLQDERHKQNIEKFNTLDKGLQTVNTTMSRIQIKIATWTGAAVVLGTIAGTVLARLVEKLLK